MFRRDAWYAGIARYWPRWSPRLEAESRRQFRTRRKDRMRAARGRRAMRRRGSPFRRADMLERSRARRFLRGR